MYCSMAALRFLHVYPRNFTPPGVIDCRRQAKEESTIERPSGKEDECSELQRRKSPSYLYGIEGKGIN